jgi:hypothetical protein
MALDVVDKSELGAGQGVLFLEVKKLYNLYFTCPASIH